MLDFFFFFNITFHFNFICLTKVYGSYIGWSALHWYTRTHVEQNHNYVLISYICTAKARDKVFEGEGAPNQQPPQQPNKFFCQVIK